MQSFFFCIQVMEVEWTQVLVMNLSLLWLEEGEDDILGWYFHCSCYKPLQNSAPFFVFSLFQSSTNETRQKLGSKQTPSLSISFLFKRMLVVPLFSDHPDWWHTISGNLSFCYQIERALACKPIVREIVKSAFEWPDRF